MELIFSTQIFLFPACSSAYTKYMLPETESSFAEDGTTHCKSTLRDGCKDELYGIN